jgi:enamine deaminase RidA (YjgF/YER057c/UK114 family)
MLIHRNWLFVNRLDFLQISVAGIPGHDVRAATSTALATAIDELQKHGIPAGHIVRSRVWGRDGETRVAASDVRRLALSAEKRGASSSFYDAERLPADTNVLVEIIGMRIEPTSQKVVQDYEKPVAAPRFVRLGRTVFLSGVTDTAEGIGAQVERIRQKIEGSLQIAGCRWADVMSASAYVAKHTDCSAAQKALETHLPRLNCPVSMTTVQGLSAPEKLIEIEVSAVLG